MGWEAGGPKEHRARPPSGHIAPHNFSQLLFSLSVQARLRHIGPEEFVQAFVNKDPLASTKVDGPWTAGTH